MTNDMFSDDLTLVDTFVDADSEVAGQTNADGMHVLTVQDFVREGVSERHFLSCTFSNSRYMLCLVSCSAHWFTL